VRRLTVRVPVPEPGESGGATLAGLAGFVVAAVAYLAGHRRGEVFGWGAGFDQGVATGREVQRRWPGEGRRSAVRPPGP